MNKAYLATRFWSSWKPKSCHSKTHHQTYHQLLIDDHLADDGVDDRFLQLKHLGQDGQWEVVVDTAVAKQISPQTLLLDLGGDQVTHLVPLEEQVPHLHATGQCAVIHHRTTMCCHTPQDNNVLSYTAEWYTSYSTRQCAVIHHRMTLCHTPQDDALSYTTEQWAILHHKTMCCHTSQDNVLPYTTGWFAVIYHRATMHCHTPQQDGAQSHATGQCVLHNRTMCCHTPQDKKEKKAYVITTDGRVFRFNK